MDSLEDCHHASIDETTSRCPLCEGSLYHRTIYHICCTEDGKRVDLFYCSECKSICGRVNGEKVSGLVHECFACECEDEDDV